MDQIFLLVVFAVGVAVGWAMRTLVSDKPFSASPSSSPQNGHAAHVREWFDLHYRPGGHKGPYGDWSDWDLYRSYVKWAHQAHYPNGLDLHINSFSQILDGMGVPALKGLGFPERPSIGLK